MRLGLTGHEERQAQALVMRIRCDKLIRCDHGSYEQAPSKPLVPPVIREDDGTIRTNGMMKWFTQAQMIDHLNGEPRTLGIRYEGDGD